MNMMIIGLIPSFPHIRFNNEGLAGDAAAVLACWASSCESFGTGPFLFAVSEEAELCML